MRIFWKFWEFRSGKLKKKKKKKKKKKNKKIFEIWRKMKRKQEEGGRGRGVRGHAMNLTYYFIEIYFHLVYADFISGWLDLALQSNT